MKAIVTVLIVFFALQASGQQRTITGYVFEEQGALPGASVLIQGTNSGTVSGIDGSFQLQVNDGDTIVVSFIGYVSTTFVVGTRNTYEVNLRTDLTQLDEIVVTGYAEERKSDLAGAISVVDVKAMSKESNPNILTSLQGRVAGVQINSSGTPGGSDTQIIIRGLTTVNSGSSPLWVIDGVQTFNPSGLNPKEVESIQVLKDGASTALYGTSAANGVIVVTTQKGSKGVSEFNFQGEVTVNFLRDKIRILNAPEWTDVYYQARSNDGISGDFGPLVDNGEMFVVPEFLDEDELIPSSDTDWVDAIISNSVSYYTDLNYRYGSERVQVFTGINYAKDNGIQDFTFFERYNFRINTTYEVLKDRLTIGENFLYSNFNEVKANEFENAILQNPLLPVYTTIGTYTAPVIQDKPNAVANLWSNRKNLERNNRFLGNLFADLKIIKGLSFNTKLNFDYNRFKFDTRPEPFVQMTEIPSVFQNIDVDAVNDTNLRTIWTNLLTYDRQINKHRFNVFLGLEFTRQDEEFLTERIRGVDITEYPIYIIRADAEFQRIEDKIEYRKQSQFASAKYIYDDRFILAGTIRRDGSSRFGPNNKYAVFPSASVAWNVNKESFLENSGVVSNLKLRFSWGINGNDIIGDYLYANAFIDNTVGDVIEFSDYNIDGSGFGTTPGILQARQANPDIQWEQTTQTNIGFDIGVFTNRLTLTVDLFDKTTDNLILQPIAQAITGESDPPTINAGEVSNRGFEAIISYKNAGRSDFLFGADFNISSYRNKVVSLDTDNNFLLNNSISITRPGDPIASFFGLISDGIFRTPEEVAVHADQPGKAVGRIRYRDFNKDGRIDNDDRTVIGNPHPDFIYGINLTASYRGFDCALYFDGKQGNDLYNLQRIQGDFTFFSFNFGRNTLDSWTPERANSNIPELTTNDSNNETQPSSYFVEDGSYFRLKNITVGYTFNFNNSRKMGLKHLRLYFLGQNLINFTSFTGFDYEVAGLSAGGIGIAGYEIPHTKSISFGLNASF